MLLLPILVLTMNFEWYSVVDVANLMTIEVHKMRIVISKWHIETYILDITQVVTFSCPLKYK